MKEAWEVNVSKKRERRNRAERREMVSQKRMLFPSSVGQKIKPNFLIFVLQITKKEEGK